MTNKNQLKLAKNMWEIGERAIGIQDKATLINLAYIAESIEAETQGSYINFFDLGEYFYDYAKSIKGGIDPSSDEWGQELKEKISASLKEKSKQLYS